MPRCPTCYHENSPTSTYCENCGTLLSASVSSADPTYRTPSDPYTPLPPPPPESIPPTQLASTSVPQRQRRKTRTGGETVLSILLYCWGIFWLAFGLGGGVLHDAGSTIIGIVFYGGCLVGLGLLIFLLLKRPRLSLRLWERVGLELGLVVIGFLVLLIVYELQGTSQYDVHALGAILAGYGLLTAFAAFW